MSKVGEEEVAELRRVDLVAEEWTHPADGEKELFFRNLFGTIAEATVLPFWLGSLVMWIRIMVVMWELDNYPVFVDCDGWRGRWRSLAEEGITYGIMGVAWAVGRCVGWCRVEKWQNGKRERKMR